MCLQAMLSRLMLAGACAVFLAGCSAEARKSEPNRKLERILVFSKTAWYRHEAIPQINEYLVRLGKENRFHVDATEESAVFAPEKLTPYQVLVFNNTTDVGKSLTEAQKKAFVDWFRRGGGYVGLHAASVQHDTWPWYTSMIGTNFNSDVEHQRGRVVVDPMANNHPAVKHMAPEIWLSEEWMNYETSVRGLKGTTVLLTLDERTIDTTVKKYFQDKGGRPMGKDHPIAWTRLFEGGRVFYTNFGHDMRALEKKAVRAHVLQGIRWAAGVHERERIP